jgi:PAS domain S-box-containing protein
VLFRIQCDLFSVHENMTAPKNRSLRTINLDSRLRIATLAFLVAGISYLAAKLAELLTISVPQTEFPLWPGCAVLAAILLLLPRKLWPITLGAGLSGFVFYDLQAGIPIHSIAWLILADTVEILVATLGLSYALDGHPRLSSLKALAKYFFVTVFLASLLVSLVGMLGSNGNQWLSGRISFLSEALAFLTFTPAVLGLAGKQWRSLRVSLARYLEAAVLMTGLAALSYFIFATRAKSYPPALLYCLVPFLIWTALRFGTSGVGASATIVALISIWGAVRGYGPFTETVPLNRVLSLQIFLLFTSIPFMVLAALVEEHNRARSELREGEERLRFALDSGKAVVWEWNFNSGQDFWFGDLNAMFKTEPEGFLGSADDFHRYVHPHDRLQVAEAEADAKETHNPYSAEFRVISPDDDMRWVAASGKFYYSPNGEPERMAGIVVDITDRKQLELKLRDSQDRMEAILTTAMDAIIVVDEAQQIVLFNAAAEKMFGCAVEDALNRPLKTFVPQLSAAVSGRILQSGEPDIVRNMDALGTLVASRADGSEFHIEVSISHIDAAGKKLFTMILRDVTDRERAEVAVADVGRRLLRAEEQERARIARELHDDIGQRLALLTVELSQPPIDFASLPDEVSNHIRELQKQSAEIASDVQSLSHKLHSSKLEYLGIAMAMKGFCRELALQKNVEIAFAHDTISQTVPTDISLCLFRVLQEGLNNAFKYSGVLRFQAELRESSDAIELMIHDSGSGFDVQEAMKTSGLGLISMSERLKLVGGNLCIESQPEQGTTIRAHVPLHQSSRAAHS